MTWLLRLYPPRWRRRYGDEFLVLIAARPFSFGTALDIIGGAIDAWTRPQSHLAARGGAQPEGETVMLAKTMRLRCAGYGAQTIFLGAQVVVIAFLVFGAAWLKAH